MDLTLSEGMRPVLIIIDSSGSLRQYEIGAFEKPVLSIGRIAGNNDIVIPDKFVSSRHGQIRLYNGAYYYCDLHSSNGTYVTSASRTKLLKNTDEMVELSNHATIRIGSESDPSHRLLLWFTYMQEGEVIDSKSIEKDYFTIGRAPTNDIVLPHPSVSRIHAVIQRQQDGYFIKDNKSTNGVLLNGARLERDTLLRNKDIIQISGFQIVFSGNSFFYRNRINGVGIIARNINKFVGSGKGEKQILHEANVTINANEFVAIIGGSGAGKSTIMNVLNGFDRNYSGDVFYNDISLQDNFQLLKSIIGYVPQDDIIYENLTLRKMLQYTAQLRMPKDIERAEIEDRINDVLETLDLTEHQGTMIRKMSGGQKKRASIAVELLADPKLFFLDEPTSGLDPGTEKSLMTSMKRLCKEQERTIVMVTHTTQSLHLCDKVIFMGPGGRVCFVGNVEEAKKFFECDDLTEIYNIIARGAEFWEEKFAKQGQIMPSSGGDSDIQKFSRQTVPAFHQLATLLRRYTELLSNDRRKLLILLLEPVLIGLLLYIVAGDNVFNVFSTGYHGSDTPTAVDAYNETKSIMFTLSCAAIWIGLFNSIQEVCKERNILKREYMANLRLTVYMGSKVIVQTIIGLVQAVLLTMTFLCMVGKFTNDGEVEIPPEGLQTMFDSGSGMALEIILSVWITIIAAMSLGLIVSSLVKTGDKAMVVAPFLLIVQLLFSGFLFELKAGIGIWISKITISKWSVDSLCRICNIGNIDSEFEDRIKDDLADFQWDASQIVQDWWILLLMAAVCIAVSILVLRNVAKDSR